MSRDQSSDGPDDASFGLLERRTKLGGKGRESGGVGRGEDRKAEERGWSFSLLRSKELVYSIWPSTMVKSQSNNKLRN